MKLLLFFMLAASVSAQSSTPLSTHEKLPIGNQNTYIRSDGVEIFFKDALTGVELSLADLNVAAASGIPDYYLASGGSCYYEDTNSVSFTGALICTDDDNVTTINVSTTVQVNLDDSGIGGLTDGDLAADTLYYFYAIEGTTDADDSIFASTSDKHSGDSVTKPGGYTGAIRQLHMAVLTDGSSNLYNFRVANWPKGTEYKFYDLESGYTGSTDTGLIKLVFYAGSSPTDWTTLDISSVHPSGISERAVIHTQMLLANVQGIHIKPWGSAATHGHVSYKGTSSGMTLGDTTNFELPIVQGRLQYKAAAAAGNWALVMLGWKITQLP